MTQRGSGEPGAPPPGSAPGAGNSDEQHGAGPRTLSCAPGRKLPPLPPTVPDAPLDLRGEAVLRDKGSGTRTGAGGYGPFFLEYSLMAEYQLMKKTKPSGVYVVPSAHCPLVWHGVLFVRQGVYQDAVLRFTLHIPPTFPDGDCPTVQFAAPVVFHPLVHPQTGKLDVQRAFQRWRRNYNHVWQVVHYIRKSFYKLDTLHPLNPEAASLCEQDVEEFKRRVSESMALCKADLYSDPDPSDPHTIRFSPPVEPLHLADKKSRMLLHKDASQSLDEVRSIESLGLSWMRPDSDNISPS